MTQVPGEHVPPIKNRSSKHLIKLTKVKPMIKSVSNERLNAMIKSGDHEASKERTRRNKKLMKRKIEVPDTLKI